MPDYPKVKFAYTIPKPICKYCGYQIKQGKDMYTVIEYFGRSKIACKLCALKIKYTKKVTKR